MSKLLEVGGQAALGAIKYPPLTKILSSRSLFQGLYRKGLVRCCSVKCTGSEPGGPGFGPQMRHLEAGQVTAL